MIEQLIWRLTGWIPAAWAERDNAASYRYWTGLVEARVALSHSHYPDARAAIERALASPE